MDWTTVETRPGRGRCAIASSAIPAGTVLSQFSGEKEVLFPPCTMLEVKRQAITHFHEAVVAVAPQLGKRRGSASTYSRYQAQEDKEGEVQFLQVSVLPSFL